ncbi:MAG: diguanylate cyclase [Deltaproteobacteria bacterium]|nr:diguanylate cyclase [Deltaproteobacteria bacterium]
MDEHAPRILIIDNDADSAAAAMQHLTSEGFRVEVSPASGGAAAWLAQTFKPWVVVARHELPDTDGLEACRLIKNDPETSHVSVILVCSRVPDDRFVVRALEAGVSQVLPALPSKDLLLAHVHAQLNVFQMVMELREKNHYLRDLVQRDPMTGLFNHAYLHEVLEREIGRAQRTGSPCSLLLIDLDHFKQINDKHGHQAGDYCLRTAAELFASSGRRSDAVARYGGDEFAILLPDTNRAGAAARGEALRAAMQHRGSERRLPDVTLSVGVASYPEDGADRTQLLAAADRALYAAKRIGRNRVVAYSSDLGAPDELPATESGAEIERLLAINEVVNRRLAGFVYQPILSAETGAIFAFEALCRPKHASFPHPGSLFQTAEHAGRVVDLGRALRPVALEPLLRLPGDSVLFLNLHPLELADELVEEALEHYGAHAERIVFEVTESSQIHDYNRMRDLISSLQSAKFRVAIDDLGAGYAGLNSVALLKPDIVKLDMALVRGIQRDGAAARLIKHLLEYARGENLQVVAEGIETADERRVVTDLGVPLLQGYYFAKPGPPFPEVKGLTAWLSKSPGAKRARGT